MEPVQHGRVAVVKVGAGAQADLCYLVVLAVLLSITQCVLVLQKVLVLQNFFSCKITPRTAKTIFANPKGPPFGR